MQRLMLLLAPWLLCSFGLAGADDDVVRDFKKLFRKFKEPAERVEAVLALEGIDEASVVDALLPVLREDDARVRGAAIRVLSRLEGPDPLAALEGAFTDAKKTDEVTGLLEVYVRSGRALATEDGLERIEECIEDRDWQLRVEAVRGVPTMAPERAVEWLSKAAVDDELAVRCASVEALGQLGGDPAVDVALSVLDAPEWQLRASAVGVLGAIRRQRSIGPLVDRLQIEEGRLVADIAASLESLTGRRFGTRVALWRDFWVRQKDRYRMPTDAELAALRERERENAAAYGATEDVAYHGIETPSTRILFVVDVSGSMDDLVVERDRFAGREFRSWRRMDVVRGELQRAIEALDENVEFNILAFSRDLDPWRKKPVPANVLQKTAAVEWLDGIDTVGGVEDKELARAGLVGAADLDAGRTNSYAALMYSLGVIDARGKSLDERDYALPVDTIFFLSDGVPSVGEFIDPDDILREVRKVNALRKVVIHTLALGQFRKTFMERLAAENGGSFADLGK
ncbi:MAG: HEAT repeat domain-containing protein [Planctomycetota bacterium]|jgi:hypothetical protein